MPYLRKTGLLAITCLSLTIFGAMTARADTVVFTNRAAFTAASTVLTTINFEGIAAANSVGCARSDPDRWAFRAPHRG